MRIDNSAVEMSTALLICVEREYQTVTLREIR